MKRNKEKLVRTRVSSTALYSALSSKIATHELNKKVKDPKVESHLPVVLQSLLKIGRPASLEDVVAAVKATGRYRTKKGLERWVRVDLSVLAREGLVKIAEKENVEAAA